VSLNSRLGALELRPSTIVRLALFVLENVRGVSRRQRGLLANFSLCRVVRYFATGNCSNGPRISRTPCSTGLIIRLLGPHVKPPVRKRFDRPTICAGPAVPTIRMTQLRLFRHVGRLTDPTRLGVGKIVQGQVSDSKGRRGRAAPNGPKGCVRRVSRRWDRPRRSRERRRVRRPGRRSWRLRG
jgi:hypothetical protein